MRATPQTLQISDDLREKFRTAILKEIKEAVRGARERDDFYVECYEMVNGLTPVTTNAPWNDACNLQYQLVRKMKLILMAQIIAAVKRNPKVVVECNQADEDKGAKSQEDFLSSKDQELGWTKALVTAADYASTYGTGYIAQVWEECWLPHRFSLFRDRESNALLPEEGIDPERPDSDYEEEPRRGEKLAFKGVRFRVPHPADMYVFPPNSLSLECHANASARGVGERLEYSEGDLLQGIEEYGFEYDCVMDAIERGPSRYNETRNELRRDRDDHQGVQETERDEDRYYEVFTWYTKVPHIYDNEGDLETPDYLLGDELIVSAIPSQDLILRMDLCPEEFRPYTLVYILESEGDLYGIGLPELFYTEQSESNAIVRHFIDSMDLTTNPVIVTTDASDKLNESTELFPGRVMLEKTPGDTRALEFPQSNHDAFLVLSTLEGTAKEMLVGNASYGRQTKVIKAQQAQQEQQQTSTMVSLYLYYFLQAVERTAARTIALYATHMDESGEEFLDEFNHAKRVTPQELRGDYTYRAVASDLTADPIARLQLAEKRKQFSIEWLTAKQGLMQSGDFEGLKQLWHAFRECLSDTLAHDPEQYIGEEPNPQQLAEAMKNRPPQPGGSNGAPPPGGNARNGNGTGNGSYQRYQPATLS